METSAAGSAESGTLPGMSFDDLPGNWSELPLDTPGLAADVADLFVSVRERDEGCLALLLTDSRLRMTQPCIVNEVTDEALEPEEFAGFLLQLGRRLYEEGPDGRGAGETLGVVFVRGRPGSVLLTDRDRRWHQVVVDACRRSGLTLVGAFLATPAVVRSFPEPLAVTDAAS